MKVRKILRNYLRKFGLDIVSYDPVYHSVARRLKLMSVNNIDLVFDVGANTGQYGMFIRDIGYKGRIVSFEPLTSAYKLLENSSSTDGSWDAVNIALGNEDGITEINISSNSQSSSILNMLPNHVAMAPGSAYVGREEIVIRKLDTIFHDYYLSSNNVYLKIDAQGFEKNIIDGAKNVLDKIAGVQMELSLVPLYEGETLLGDMINYMKSKNYIMMSVEPTYGNPDSGQLLQADCLFFKET
jgi:FkbM family methyltransferase